MGDKGRQWSDKGRPGVTKERQRSGKRRQRGTRERPREASVATKGGKGATRGDKWATRGDKGGQGATKGRQRETRVLCGLALRAAWSPTCRSLVSLGRSLVSLCRLLSLPCVTRAWLAPGSPGNVRHVAISGVARAGSGWLAPSARKFGCQMKRSLVGI